MLNRLWKRESNVRSSGGAGLDHGQSLSKVKPEYGILEEAILVNDLDV